jgi:hypothetical protein
MGRDIAAAVILPNQDAHDGDQLIGAAGAVVCNKVS